MWDGLAQLLLTLLDYRCGRAVVQFLVGQSGHRVANGSPPLHQNIEHFDSNILIGSKNHFPLGNLKQKLENLP